MKSANKKISIILIGGLSMLSNERCRQAYVLPLSAANGNYLVVEGLINNYPVITLSRTVKLNDTVSSKPELGATVTIESKTPGGSAGVFPFGDGGNGSYYLTYFVVDPVTGYYADTPINLDINNTYRIKIVTSNGKVYVSDYVPVKTSPPIDSVSYQATPKGLQIYSATHDPANNTRYYRWDYNETWVIHSKYPSLKEALGVGYVVNRPTSDQIFTCWANATSTNIVLNSSSKLSRDVIIHNPITFVPSSSEKLGIEYSVDVNQYALTKEAYDYWQNLKTNTEQLGSIFDAQPSTMEGNIHCVNTPLEPVIGFISAGIPAEARLFVGNSSLPYYWYQQIKSPYGDCKVDSLYFIDPNQNNTNSTLDLVPGGSEVPLDGILNAQMALIGYTASYSYCVDCRFRGSNRRPYFWIDKF